MWFALFDIAVDRRCDWHTFKPFKFILGTKLSRIFSTSLSMIGFHYELDATKFFTQRFQIKANRNNLRRNQRNWLSFFTFLHNRKFNSLLFDWTQLPEFHYCCCCRRRVQLINVDALFSSIKMHIRLLFVVCVHQQWQKSMARTHQVVIHFCQLSIEHLWTLLSSHNRHEPGTDWWISLFHA